MSAAERHGLDVLQELRQAAQRKEELAAAYQRKARTYRGEAREIRGILTRLEQGESTWLFTPADVRPGQ